MQSCREEKVIGGRFHKRNSRNHVKLSNQEIENGMVDTYKVEAKGSRIYSKKEKKKNSKSCETSLGFKRLYLLKWGREDGKKEEKILVVIIIFSLIVGRETLIAHPPTHLHPSISLKNLLSNLGWPGTLNSPTSTSHVLGLQTCSWL